MKLMTFSLPSRFKFGHKVSAGRLEGRAWPQRGSPSHLLSQPCPRLLVDPEGASAVPPPGPRAAAQQPFGGCFSGVPERERKAGSLLSRAQKRDGIKLSPPPRLSGSGRSQRALHGLLAATAPRHARAQGLPDPQLPRQGGQVTNCTSSGESEPFGWFWGSSGWGRGRGNGINSV